MLGIHQKRQRLTRFAEWRELATGMSRSRIERREMLLNLATSSEADASQDLITANDRFHEPQLDACNRIAAESLRREDRIACKQLIEKIIMRAKRSIIISRDRLCSNEDTARDTRTIDKVCKTRTLTN